jgi:hypothetical protein
MSSSESACNALIMLLMPNSCDAAHLWIGDAGFLPLIQALQSPEQGLNDCRSLDEHGYDEEL